MNKSRHVTVKSDPVGVGLRCTSASNIVKVHTTKVYTHLGGVGGGGGGSATVTPSRILCLFLSLPHNLHVSSFKLVHMFSHPCKSQPWETVHFLVVPSSPTEGQSESLSSSSTPGHSNRREHEVDQCWGQAVLTSEWEKITGLLTSQGNK